MPYSETFKDHVANPRNVGELPAAEIVAEESNPVCGDRLRLSLHLDKGTITNARFLAYGCPATIACGSALTILITGKSTAEALSLTRDDLIKTLGGIPARKQHAAALALETLQRAIGER